MKKSFVMYSDWSDMIDELSVSERGELLQAIMHYQTGQDIPELSPCARVAFAQIKSQFRKDDEKYEESKQKRIEAGRAGGLKRSSNAKQKQAMLSSAKQNQANQAVNVNVNDNVIKESTLKGTKEKFKPPTIEEVKMYCAERGNAVDAEHFVDFYESKGWMVGKNKMKDWKSAVRNWERSSQRQEKTAKVNNKFNNFEQRKYNFDDLERQLLRGG